MKEHTDKYLDDLIKKVIKETPIEQTSFNFTETVMSQVGALSTSSVTTYKPLISKKAWVFIAVVFLLTIVYLFFENNHSTSPWLNALDLSVLSDNKVTKALSNFSISNTLMYAIGFFGLMVCIQVTLLKQHFDKRFEA